MQMAFDYDLDRPVFINPTHQFSRQGLDNPDASTSTPTSARASSTSSAAAAAPRADLSFQVMGGTYSADSAATSLMAFDDRELDIAADGTFEFTYVGRARRQDDDRARGLQRLGHRGARHAHHRAPRHASASRPSRCRRGPLAQQVRGGRPQPGRQHPDLVRLPAVLPVQGAGQHPDRTAVDAGRPGLAALLDRALRARRRRGDDRDRAECADCAYQAIQIGSDWYASTDYETHQTSLTKAQAVTDPDGKMRFVISEQQPGGTDRQLARDHRPPHRRDDAALAAARARPHPGADGPTIEIVAVRRRTEAPPALLTPLTTEEYAERIAARQRSVARRMIS